MDHLITSAARDSLPPAQSTLVKMNEQEGIRTTPITIPPELVCMIVDQLAPTTDLLPEASEWYRLLQTLRLVSSRWNEMIVGRALYWTYIDSDVPLRDTALQRSGVDGLHVVQRWDSRDDVKSLESVCQHSRRWETLEITSPPNPDVPRVGFEQFNPVLTHLLLQPVDRLRQARIHTLPRDFFAPIEGYGHQICGTLSNLRDVLVHGCGLNWGAMKLGELRKLDVIRDIVDDDAMTCPDLLHILRRSPSIAILRARCKRNSFDAQTASQIFLENLTDLHLVGSPNDLERLVPLLQLPNTLNSFVLGLETWAAQEMALSPILDLFAPRLQPIVTALHPTTSPQPSGHLILRLQHKDFLVVYEGIGIHYQECLPASREWGHAELGRLSTAFLLRIPPAVRSGQSIHLQIEGRWTRPVLEKVHDALGGLFGRFVSIRFLDVRPEHVADILQTASGGVTPPLGPTGPSPLFRDITAVNLSWAEGNTVAQRPVDALIGRRGSRVQRVTVENGWLSGVGCNNFQRMLPDVELVIESEVVVFEGSTGAADRRPFQGIRL